MICQSGRATRINPARDATRLAWGELRRNGYPVPAWGEAGDYGSYGINAWTHNPPDALLGQFTPNFPTYYWRKISAVQSGQSVPVFADCIWDGTAPMFRDGPSIRKGWQLASSSMTDFCIPRHDGSSPVNIAFVDASVQSSGLKQLWTYKWYRQFDTTFAETRIQWPAWMDAYK